MKRTLVKFGMFLLLGAVMNVAVAWAIAYWAEYPPTAVLEEIRYVDAPKDISHWTFVARGFGSELVYGKYGGVFYERGHSMPNVARVPPRKSWLQWSEIRERSYEEFKADMANDELRLVGEEACGWPVRSFSWQHQMAKNSEGQFAYGHVTGGINLHGDEQAIPYKVEFLEHLPAEVQQRLAVARHSTHIGERVIPCTPIWEGIGLNTLFYAVVLFAVLTIARLPRTISRARRGLCPACAYPIGTSPVCTECGKGLRLR